MDRPKVGLGVVVIKDGKVLMGKRKNAHGEGDWCFPGGHLEAGESFAECSRREVMEEVGIEIANMRCGAVTNDIFTEEDKHYITIYMVADFAGGEVQLMEPHKCEGWQWFDWESLPSPLFLPTINLLAQKFHPLLPETWWSVTLAPEA